MRCNKYSNLRKSDVAPGLAVRVRDTHMTHEEYSWRGERLKNGEHTNQEHREVV